MLKIANQETKKNLSSQEIVPQRQIEIELAKVVNLGNLECVYLFSEDGLLIAGIQGRSDFTQDNASEMVYSVHDGFEYFDNTTGFNGAIEILLLGRSRRRVSIRSFKAFGQNVKMVLVIPKGKTYRFLTNRLIRIIREISKASLN